MYTAFYGLREKPFVLSPDPRFLFLSESHREALAHLLYGVEQGEGFIAVTGEVGTGKTTICRSLLERLGSDTEIAFLFNPSRSATELLQSIADEFGVRIKARTRGELNAALNRFLLDRRAAGRRVLLIIDEAQNLSASTLEQVRLLSNLETSSSKLIQILLLGQPELDRKLDSPGLRQLRQRIGVRWALAPLSASETREYVRHRLRVAAGAERDIFSESALREVHRRTRGVPRLVNVLCDRALLAGYAAGEHRIGMAVVRKAAREIPDARRSARRSRGPDVGASGRQLNLTGWLAAAAIVAVVVAGVTSVGSTLLRGFPSSQDAGTSAVSSAPPSRLDAAIAPSLRDEDWVGARVPGGSHAGVVTHRGPLEPDPEAGQFFGRILAFQDAEDASLQGVNAVLTAFGAAPVDKYLPSIEAGIARLIQADLIVLALEDTDLDTLLALNHPALLRLRTHSGEERIVALRGLDDGFATLHGATGRGPLRTPISELEALWDRDAFVVWDEFEEVDESPLSGSRPAGIEWLQGALAELGGYEGPATGVFDAQTLQALRGLQERLGIEADGTIGPATRMALYDRLSYPVPRLASRSETVDEDGHETQSE